MRYLIVIAIVLLAGCKEAPVKTLPPAEVVKVYVPTYVPIDKKLTARCSWPKGKKLLDVVEVAKARRVCLEKYELHFDAIDDIQGKPVP